MVSLGLAWGLAGVSAAHHAGHILHLMVGTANGPTSCARVLVHAHTCVLCARACLRSGMCTGACMCFTLCLVFVLMPCWRHLVCTMWHSGGRGMDRGKEGAPLAQDASSPTLAQPTNGPHTTYTWPTQSLHMAYTWLWGWAVTCALLDGLERA